MMSTRRAFKLLTLLSLSILPRPLIAERLVLKKMSVLLYHFNMFVIKFISKTIHLLRVLTLRNLIEH